MQAGSDQAEPAATMNTCGAMMVGSNQSKEVSNDGTCLTAVAAVPASSDFFIGRCILSSSHTAKLCHCCMLRQCYFRPTVTAVCCTCMVLSTISLMPHSQALHVSMQYLASFYPRCPAWQAPMSQAEKGGRQAFLATVDRPMCFVTFVWSVHYALRVTGLAQAVAGNQSFSQLLISSS